MIRALGKEIQNIDRKKREFEQRNVDFILNNCKQAGVDPIENHSTSREKLK